MFESLLPTVLEITCLPRGSLPRAEALVECVRLIVLLPAQLEHRLARLRMVRRCGRCSIRCCRRSRRRGRLEYVYAIVSQVGCVGGPMTCQRHVAGHGGGGVCMCVHEIHLPINNLRGDTETIGKPHSVCIELLGCALFLTSRSCKTRRTLLRTQGAITLTVKG